MDVLQHMKDGYSSTANRMLETSWESKDAYAEWLAQSHFYVKHSTPLLMLAGALVAKEDYFLHNRFVEHASEEKGHSELLIADLHKTGHNIKEHNVHPTTAAFFQTQYYWVSHVSPQSFFGYILFLEGLAIEVCNPMAEIIEKHHGRASNRFLAVHGAEDPGHVESAIEQINKFKPEYLEQIISNFDQSKFYYDSMLDYCQEIANNGKSEAA